MGGAGELGEVKRHFSALRVAFPDMRGVCLLDRDKGSGRELEDFPNGLTLLRWNRYEIENYLLNPVIIKRFLKQSNTLGPADGEQPALPLVSAETIEQDLEKVDQAFARQGLANLDYLSDDVQSLRDLKASDLLVDILGDTHRRLAKRDLYLLARIMNPDEIHSNVISKLDAIASMLPAPVAEEGGNGELVEDEDDA